MQHFENKVVVITGAGSGIGRALTQAFAKQGARLALNDLKSNDLNETVHLLPNTDRTKVFTRSFDVAVKEEHFAFADQVVQHFGQVDIVVNNAGMALGDFSFDQVQLDHFERVMDVNFRGVLYGSKAFYPHLLERPEAALVNISSIFGLAGISGGAAYCTSKFAVNGLNQTLIQETYGTSLCVHSVHPGGIATNISNNALAAGSEADAFAEKHLKHAPEKAAKIILKGIKRKKHRIFIGPEAYQLDYLVRLSPITGSRIINKFVR